MSEISIYDVVPTPKLADKLIGTSVGGVIPDVTYNFTLEELLQLFIPNIPANTLQGVLDYGNTATQDINLTGTINTTDLNVFATANILDSILSGETHITGELYDGLDSKGTAGQVLRSTGSGVEWYTIPTVIPTLQQVLTSGNTADKNIILTANITAVTATATNVVSNSSLSVNGSLKDGTASTGSTDQLLSSTGSGVRWVDMPVYNAVSPLLYNNTTKTFSIQVANSSQGGYLSNADWINFDGKQDAIVLTTAGTSGAATFVGNTLNIPVYTPDLSGYVPISRTLTINGVTYDLSANRSWTVDAGVAEVTATAPLYSSGGAYPDISISQSNSSTDGYLSSADWLAFNSKQDALGGTGLVKSTAGTITYITDNSSNWNTAYNESIISAAVTGTSTKTLTLNQQDGGTIQASWSDADTGLTSVGLSMPSAFTVTNSPLTSNGTIGVTGAGTTAQYVRGDGSLATFPTIAPEAATLVTEVYNETGATLTKGTVVYINGGHGNLPTVAKALATGDATSAQTYGVVQVDITNMNNGHVVVIGSLGDLDTQAYANGTQLYLSSTTAGAWTSVKQYAPAHLVYVGVVVRSHPTQGVVEIKIQNGYEMDELHNVYAQNPNNNAILQYKTATSLWTSVDGTTTNIAEGTNLYYLDSRARAAISLTTTGSSGAATYNSTTGVFNIPNYGSALTAYVPYTGATANVNLGTYNLTADSLIKSGGTSSQFLKADGSVDSSAYITLTSLSAAAPLSYDNSIGAFSISQAGASADGYLSSADWTTFNNKQVAGNYITSLTGEATGTGPGATAVTLNNASVTGKVLTGVNITGGSVVATDTMLTAFGKLQNQINGLIGSTIYQGTWNANTNTPALASSVGTRGYYYIVNVAGNTNLNGITDWQVGDWAIYDGSAWQKVDNTDSVTSVNGFTGAVSLTTDNIAQGTTNLYFANSLARSAVSLTTTGSSGAATYNNTTGVFNIPNYGTALANYLPLTGGTLTGALLINPSDTAVVGLNVASDTVILRSDSTQPFRRQLTTTMGSGTLIKMQASGSGAVYVTDLGFYTSSSSAVNTTPNLYLTGGNNRVGINTDTPANTLDVVGTAGVSGVLTLGSTISNGTYTYTLPSATGTLALVGGTGVGTVTSVAALTIGTTGTDLSSTVANSTTTPVITLNVPTASGTNRGALSAADWTTFNNKQAALNGTGFVKSTAGVISYDTNTYLTTSAAASTYVPYTGATSAVNIGTNVFTAGYAILNGSGLTNDAGVLSLFKGTSRAVQGNGYTNIYAEAGKVGFNDWITGNVRTFELSLASLTAGVTRVYTLPNASGTLALSSDLSSYVPYTGATGAVNLGAYDLTVNGIKVGKGAGSIADNTVVGASALTSNTTGSSNTAIGFSTLSVNTIAGGNTAIGTYALSTNISGGTNTAIGYSAGSSITTGSNNVIIGGYAGTSAMANNVILSDGGGNIRFQFDGTNTILGQSGSVILNGVLSGTSATFNSSFSNTSDMQIVANGNIAGINIRSTSGGRLSILQNFIAPDVTSFLTSTGTNNPSVEAIRITNGTGAATFSSTVTSTLFTANATANGSSEYYFFRGNGAVSNNFTAYAYDNNVYLNAYNTLHFRANNTGGSGGYIVLSGGSVGIGVLAPQSLFDVTNIVNTAYDASNTLISGQTMRIANTSTTSGISANLLFVATGAGGGNGLGSISGVNTGTGSLALTFATRDSSGSVSEKVRITSLGNLLVNTTTDAGYKLDVNGTGRFSGITTFGSTGGSGLRVYGGSGTNQWDIYLNSTNLRFSDNTGTGSVVFDRPLSGTSATFSGDITTSNNTANVRVNINNTTTTTGRSWYLNSYSNGNLYVGNGTAGDIFNFSSTGAATFSSSVTATQGIFSQAMTNGSTSAFTNPNLALKATSSTDTTGFIGMTFATSDANNYGFSYGALRTSGGLGNLVWRNHFNSAQGNELLRLTYNGNLGLGVSSLDTWDSTIKAIEVGSVGNFYAGFNGGPSVIYLGTNAYYNSGWKYAASNGYKAQLLDAGGGNWHFQNAAAGTAGNAITWTSLMKIVDTGNVLIGTTTDSGYKLDVTGGNTIRAYSGNGTTTAAKIFIQAGHQWSLNSDVSGGGSPVFAASGFYIRNENTSNNAFGITSGGNVYIGPGFNASNHRIDRAVAQNNVVLVVSGYDGSTNDSAIFYAANNYGVNGAQTVLAVTQNSSSNRSISAGGTINASGSDYAEYMIKAVDDTIAKGDIVGINRDAKLTNVFADAISFVVKSTDPSYVGGDAWFNNEKRPQKTEDQTEEEFSTIISEFESRLEIERAKVDRVAFSGQVPCNVLNAKVGDYIVPIELENGKISGQAVSNPTFEQYQNSVGKVWKIMEDGRAWVAVKIG